MFKESNFLHNFVCKDHQQNSFADLKSKQMINTKKALCLRNFLQTNNANIILQT